MLREREKIERNEVIGLDFGQMSDVCVFIWFYVKPIRIFFFSLLSCELNPID